MINWNNNSACLTTLPQFSKQTVDITSCSGVNQCISDAPRPALIQSWGSRAPFFGKDLVVPEIQLKRTFLPQWCHSVAEKGNAQDRGLLPSLCLAGERLPAGLPGLPEALRSTSCPLPSHGLSASSTATAGLPDSPGCGEQARAHPSEARRITLRPSLRSHSYSCSA